jgi:hypothetical protein
MPIIVNTTILNGMDVVGEVVGQVKFILIISKERNDGDI